MYDFHLANRVVEAVTVQYVLQYRYFLQLVLKNPVAYRKMH